ncbi:MAG: P-loop NTPase [bacterium]
MDIAIASGKGGTGKTFISTNLAYILDNMQHQVSYLDCDVEEPDGHLFLKMDQKNIEAINLKAPYKADPKKCTGCGKCVEACTYNAIAVMKEKAIIFPELCHICGACNIVCPEDAIIEKEKKIGDVVHGKSNSIDLHYALLERGAGGMTPRLIKKVKAEANSAFNILDAPPGTACSAVETVMDSDLVVLITDPTPFGINDLKLSVQMCRTLGIEPVVIVNRAEYKDESLKNYCQEAELDIIGEIPNDREVAEIYSKGHLVAAESAKYREIFKNMVSKIKELLTKKREVKKELNFVYEKSDEIEKSVTSRPSGEDKPEELVIISGKGGTGKTSITASFAALANNTVIADCDVDASDLHLIMQPEVQESGYFSGGFKAEIIQNKCVQCSQCYKACRFDAIQKAGKNGKQQYQIDPLACEGCGVCDLVCDYHAIELSDAVNGEWFVSETRFGPMAHAQLGMAEENSGRLVSLT